MKKESFCSMEQKELYLIHRCAFDTDEGKSTSFLADIDPGEFQNDE